MSALTRQHNWSTTAVGTPDGWPQSLRTILSVMLTARFPMFLWWGPDLIQFYNDAYRPSLGVTGKHPTALGQRGEDCWPEIWPTIKPLIDEVMAGGEATWNEDQLIPIFRNGQIENVYWTYSYSPVSDGVGSVAGVLVICQETTHQVIASREEKKRFQFATEAAQVGVWELDPTTNIIHWDDRCKTLFGVVDGYTIPYEEFIRHIHPDDLDRVDTAVRWGMITQSGGRHDLTCRTIGAIDKQLRWVRFTGRSYVDALGKLAWFVGIGQDVTADMRDKQQMEASEAYLQRIFTYTAVGIAILRGPEFIIELANPGVCILWGRTEADVLGKPLFEALPEAAGQGFEALLTNVVQTGKAFTGKELPATIIRDGQLTTVYFDFVYEPLPNADGVADRILITASDATERRHSRQQVEASEASLRLLFEQAPVAIAILRGPALTYELANKLYMDLIGRTSPDNLIGKPLLVALPELRGQGIDELLREVMRTGNAFTATERSVDILRNGQLETGYFNFVYEPLRETARLEASSPVSGVFAAVIDVTEQVLARQQADQLLVRERELLDLKSNFVTLASHEFRTPMGTILSSVSLIGRYNGANDQEKRDRHVQRIKSAVYGLTSLLNDFLSLSQMKQLIMHGRPHPLHIVFFCHEVVEDMQGVIKPGQRVVYEHLSGEQTIFLDGQMLKTILINLLANASKYSADKKEIRLTTSVQGNQLLITVQDEGVGIPDTDKDKLFISFFRARNAMKIEGTGLGLYVVKYYVDLLGGTITFTSELDSGTTFTLQLPLALPTP